MSVFNSTKSIDPYILIRGSSEATGYLATTDPTKYKDLKLGVLGVKPDWEIEGEIKDNAGGVKIGSRWKRRTFKVVFQPHKVKPNNTYEDFSSYEYLMTQIFPYEYIFILQCNLSREDVDGENFWYKSSTGWRVFCVEILDKTSTAAFEDGTDEVTITFGLRSLQASDIYNPPTV